VGIKLRPISAYKMKASSGRANNNILKTNFLIIAIPF
jgi:hypothetical protein